MTCKSLIIAVVGWFFIRPSDFEKANQLCGGGPKKSISKKSRFLARSLLFYGADGDSFDEVFLDEWVHQDDW